MCCFWCHNESGCLTNDHIVPRSLGGTLDFAVQSCGSCQTKLSKVEQEVARKSILAIHALASPLSPRHPNRPRSGILQSSYVLVKNPLGGYGESLLSAGEKIRSLAHFEARVVPGEAIQVRARGATPGEAQELLNLFRSTLQLQTKLGPGELVCEITADLHLDPETTADPEFWPRLVLLPGRRLMFRARDPEELLRCAKVLEAIARSDYRVDPSRWSNDVQIVGGTPHTIALRFDPKCVRRVAAKIAYALFCTLAKGRIERAEDKRMRRYILGVGAAQDEPVSVAPDAPTSTTCSDPHYIVLSPTHDRTATFVNLYVSDLRVELGANGSLPEPIVIVCNIDGTGMRIGSERDLLTATARIATKKFSQPWLQ